MNVEQELIEAHLLIDRLIEIGNKSVSLNKQLLARVVFLEDTLIVIDMELSLNEDEAVED